ncbi:MAG TPA: sulfur oxidation c-type cytochrome SoxX [Usitatibacter sp.]
MRLALAVLACASASAFAAAPRAPALDLFVRADKGNCIACHQLPQGSGPPTRADVGPRLEGPRMRALGKDALRRWLVDPMRANPDTVMPPFGRHRLLDDAEIDRIVDFLVALP